MKVRGGFETEAVMTTVARLQHLYHYVAVAIAAVMLRGAPGPL